MTQLGARLGGLRELRSGFYEEKGRIRDNAGAGVLSKKGKRGVNKEAEQGETLRGCRCELGGA
jgi:hypothetical protein